MNRFVKSAILSAAVAATTLTAIPAANAGDGWRRHHRHHSNGDAIAAGVLGLAAGAIIGSIASQPPAYREPVYVDPYRRPVRRHYVEDRYYDEPDVVYVRRSLEPWSREWFRYCSNRYRTFDSSTGTFVGYDGREHFCTAR